MLALDIGNTNIKAGTFLNNRLTGFKVFSEVESLYSYLKNNPTDEAALSSVVPSTKKIISEEIYKISGKPPFIISQSGIKTSLTISYKTPETLGTDRLCSAEGAFFLFKNSENYKNYNAGTYIISIDLGTASTINVIEHPGKFIGGLIAPGLEMMFESLNNKTAQLPLIEINNYKDLIANDTKSSIASGVVTAVVGMIEKTINHLKKEKSAKEVFVYLTGGNAKKIIPHLSFDFTYEEGLVLYGINALYNQNKNL